VKRINVGITDVVIHWRFSEDVCELPRSEVSPKARKKGDGGRVVEIGGLTVLASTMMSLMGFCLTYCRTFLQMLNDGLRDRGKRYEGGEPECEGRNTGDQMCAVVGAPSQGDESMCSC
jgi:hypothetical protein